MYYITLINCILTVLPLKTKLARVYFMSDIPDAKSKRALTATVDLSDQ